MHLSFLMIILHFLTELCNGPLSCLKLNFKSPSVHPALRNIKFHIKCSAGSTEICKADIKLVAFCAG